MTPELGIIEGYFGRCWSWHDRAAVVRRLAPAGYRFFHYAPKIDAKLRRNWRVLYDPSEAEAIGRFAAHCRSHAMRFGIGLSPYGAHHQFDDEARAALKAKIAHLDGIGIDDLVILFDDMRGDVPDLANRQADIVSFAADHSKASRMFLCPSYYSDDVILDRVFGERPDDYLDVLGRRVDPAITMYWTGEEVCSRQFSRGHLQLIAEQMGRKIALWDNYPANDGPRMSNHLHLRAFTGRPPDVSAYVSHHAINPASQPMLSCLPALTLPQSYAQGGDYRYAAAFMAAAEALFGIELARMLRADLISLQDTGLDRLSDRRVDLRARYAGVDNLAAREIVDWLDGGYAITGEALQTQ